MGQGIVGNVKIGIGGMDNGIGNENDGMENTKLKVGKLQLLMVL